MSSAQNNQQVQKDNKQHKYFHIFIFILKFKIVTKHMCAGPRENPLHGHTLIFSTLYSSEHYKAKYFFLYLSQSAVNVSI